MTVSHHRGPRSFMNAPNPSHIMVAQLFAKVVVLLGCIVAAAPTNSSTGQLKTHASGLPNFFPERWQCHESTTIPTANKTACIVALNQIPDSSKQLLWGDRETDISGHDFDVRLPKWYLSCKQQPLLPAVPLS